MYPRLFPGVGSPLVASKSVNFGLSCLGLPSNPVLRRVWNITFQPGPDQAKERGRSAFQLVLWLGASGWPFLSAWVSWGQAPPFALSGLGAGGRFRFLRRLAVAGLAGPKLQGQAARLHREERSGPRGTGFPRLLGAAAPGLAAQGPLCGGPSSWADPSQRTIAQCCRPPGQALRATPRPPKARKPGGAFL